MKLHINSHFEQPFSIIGRKFIGRPGYAREFAGFELNGSGSSFVI
ncbi:MAG: hypothetical protein ACP5R6_08835 [Chlorobaculum sp.]